MALVQAKCSNCGANLMIQDKGEIATCPYCNSSFIIRDAINNYYYSNYISAENLTVEDTAVENKIRSAEAYLKMNRFQEALMLFTEISQSAPYDYRGWLGIIRSVTKEFTAVTCSRSSLAKLEDAFANLKLFLPSGDMSRNYSNFYSYFEQLKKRSDEDEAARTTHLRELNEERKALQEKIRECDDRIRKLQGKTYSYHNIFSGRPSQYLLFGSIILGILFLVNGGDPSAGLFLVGIPVLIILFALISNWATRQEMKETDREIAAMISEKQKLETQQNELDSMIRDCNAS